MRANERLNEIVKILNKEGRVHTKSLSELFNVSEDLIRKDLKKLEEKDLIDRIYGGAERNKQKFDASNVKYRMNIYKEEKEIIARKAVSIIDNGDTIFLDTSTTSATIAELLAKENKGVTVITNMLENIRILESNNDIRTILVGGLYNRAIGGFVGYESIETIKGYFVDKAFVSCMSVHIEDDCLVSSTKDIGFTKTAILNSAREKILVTEQRKFTYLGRVKFFKVSDLDYIITEQSPKKEFLEKISEHGIKVL